MNYNHFSNEHQYGFEAAAFYRHVVDSVWLFLYVAVYFWGGN
jgi:cytochrome c oxidase subunit 3